MNLQQVQRVRTALRNHRKPPRTRGGRIRDALIHAKKNRQCGGGFPLTSFGVAAPSIRTAKNERDPKYNPSE